MDIGGGHYNGMPQGSPLSELPSGFGMSPAMNEPVMRGYAALTESQKEELILQCKDARTKGQMQKIVDSLVPHHEMDVQAVYEEMKTL